MVAVNRKMTFAKTAPRIVELGNAVTTLARTEAKKNVAAAIGQMRSSAPGFLHVTAPGSSFVDTGGSMLSFTLITDETYLLRQRLIDCGVPASKIADGSWSAPLPTDLLVQWAEKYQSAIATELREQLGRELHGVYTGAGRVYGHVHRVGLVMRAVNPSDGFVAPLLAEIKVDKKI